MSETPPIACTLSAADLEDREIAWKTLMGSRLVQRDRVPRSHPLQRRHVAELELQTLDRQLAEVENEETSPSPSSA